MKAALAIVIAAGLATAASAQYYTAQGDFSSLGFSLDYDPSSACSKPMRPYSNDRYAWESYQAEGERYLSCLEEAANNDMRYAQRVVQEGYENAVQEFLNEVERGY
ncbi:MAG TPA: hypothetical protein DCS24_01010 [Erythrobacter sp.]|nr:hypothetical protein [Erythrobacter sp.]